LKELIGKRFKAFDKGKWVTWGQIIDIKGENAVVYHRSNPIGYRVYEERISNIEEWIRKGFIREY
jgi:hypothetical protein